MKKHLFAVIVFGLVAMSMVAQTLKPLADGTYPTSATKMGSSSPIPEKVYCEVSNSSQDEVSLRFDAGDGYETNMHLERMEGNLFVRAGSNHEFDENPTGFLVLQPGNVMELYVHSGDASSLKFERVMAIAPDGAKFGDLKKTAKAHADAFDIVVTKSRIAKANEAAVQKVGQEEAARKAAMEKAEAERRIADEKADAAAVTQRKADAEKAAAAKQNADLCTPITRFSKMAATSFKEIKGSKNEEKSESESEDIYNSTEMLPLFENGFIMPTLTDGVSKLQFYTYFASKDDADAHLALVRTKLDPCFKNKGGFTYSDEVSSNMYFYNSATVRMSLMRSSDFGDEGQTIYKALIQITKK
jgi:hypothetical protein